MSSEANVWNPRTLLELSSDTKRIEEKFVAIANQTSFSLTDFTYVVSTGSLAVFKNGLLLKEGVDWTESATGITFLLVVPAVSGDVLVAVGYVAITSTVDVRDTDIFVSNYQAVRDYAGTEITLYSQGRLTGGDGGESFFHKITGAAIGFYVDNNESVLRPSGGDGTIGWVRERLNTQFVDTLLEMRALVNITALISTVVCAEVSTGVTGFGIYDVIAGTGTADGVNKLAHLTLSFTFVKREVGYLKNAASATDGDYNDPILNVTVLTKPAIKAWANSFSQNFIFSTGGSLLNNAASGTKDGNNNTSYGFGNLLVATTSYASSAFGFNALGSVTLGNSNTALGYQALANLTTGDNNTTVGVDAGFNITTADFNTLIGRHIAFEGSGSTLLIGDNNTAIGADIALNCTTMADMCIMGTFAQQEAVTSARSVVIGTFASQLSTAATDSVLIGRNVVKTITAAISSTIEIGARVNENALSVFGNAIIGYNAFFTIAKAPSATNNNAALGYQAGLNTYGTNNIVIGHRAGAQATDLLRTGMVLIGYRAGDGSAISDDFIVSNNQNSANELIKGNFSTKAMRIEATALSLRNLPTSAGASGTLWSNSGVVTVA